MSKENDFREMLGKKNQSSDPEKSQEAKKEVVESLNHERNEENQETKKDSLLPSRNTERIQRTKTNLTISEALYKEYRMISLRYDIPTYELVEKAMERYLEEIQEAEKNNE